MNTLKFWASEKIPSQAALITPDLQPTVFVGLGGSGIKILARFRRKLFERYGDADHWDVYRFLAIDSDEHELVSGGVTGQRGHPVDARDQFCIGIEAPEVSNIIDNLSGAYRHLNSWLSPQVHEFKYTSLRNGAAQARAIGRMLFVNKVHEIRELLADRVDEVGSKDALHNPNKAGSPVNVVIVASIAGGTGAGSFLDCAMVARTLQRGRPIRIGSVVGMLVLPDVFEDEISNKSQLERVRANGYASLLELEYYNRPDCLPFNLSDWGSDFAPIGKTDVFDLCYLFSRSNGIFLETYDAIYDLVADALALSSGNGRLARAMRQLQSNSVDTYHSRGLNLTEEAQDWHDGGPDPSIEYQPPQYLRFRRSWSTRYSSLGMSSVTLKIPELRRIAAVRLLQRIADEELGGDEDKGEVASEAEQLEKRLSARRQFVKELAAEIKQSVTKALEESSDSQDARESADDVYQQLNDEIERVLLQFDERNMDRLKTTLAYRLVLNAKELAETDADAVLAPLESEWNLQRLRRLLEQVTDRMKRRTRERGDRPGVSKTAVLEQWKDMDDHDVSYSSVLGGRAIQILRTKYRTWLRENVNRKLHYVELLLREVYFRQVVQCLEMRLSEVGAGMGTLRSWKSQLEEAQDNFALQFKDERNEVLTHHLAAAGNTAPGAPEVIELDREIDQALASRAEHESDPLRAARKELMAQLPADVRAGNPPRMLMDIAQKAERRRGLMNDVIDIAVTHLLANLPAKDDLFEFCRSRKVDLLSLARESMRKADEFWPTHEDKRYLDRKQEEGLASVVVPASGDETATELERIVSDESTSWRLEKLIGADAGVVPGELVFVQESHGYSLPSLLCLDDMRRAYAGLEGNNDVMNRHVDKRLYVQGLLPELGQIGWQEADDEVRYSDIAFLAITLDLFKWSDADQSYLYTPTAGYPCVLGQTYQQAGRWLQSQGQASAHQVEQQVKSWFDEKIEQVVRGADAEDAKRRALSSITDLCIVDLAFALEEQKLFPLETQQLSSGQFVQSPSHTMLKRLRRKWVQKTLTDVLNRLGGQSDIEEIRRKLRAVLHEFVRFVGPMPDPSMAPPSWDRCVLVRAVRRPGDKSTLKTAHELGWFSDLRNWHDLPSLFHDYREEGPSEPTVYEHKDISDVVGQANPPVAPHESDSQAGGQSPSTDHLEGELSELV